MFLHVSVGSVRDTPIRCTLVRYKIYACEIRDCEIQYATVRCKPVRYYIPIRWTSVRCTTVSSLVSTFLCYFLYWTHFGFRIGAGKITTLLAVKSVEAGSNSGIQY
jgi:hypothetical protein